MDKFLERLKVYASALFLVAFAGAIVYAFYLACGWRGVLTVVALTAFALAFTGAVSTLIDYSVYGWRKK